MKGCFVFRPYMRLHSTPFCHVLSPLVGFGTFKILRNPNTKTFSGESFLQALSYAACDPLIEQITSLLILFLSIILVIWIAAKIYRIGILMYGKKPSYKEVIKWLKY